MYIVQSGSERHGPEWLPMGDFIFCIRRSIILSIQLVLDIMLSLIQKIVMLEFSILLSLMLIISSRSV